MIITLSGISGCGKTTIGSLLEQRLEEQGCRVKYRAEFDYLLLKRVLRFIHFLYKGANPQIANNISAGKNYPRIIYRIWAYLVFFDYLLEYLYLDIFFRKQIIILDRCVIDYWVEFVWMECSDKLIEWLYLKWFPKYDIMNVLTIYPEIAFNRSQDRNNSLTFYESTNEKYIFLGKLLGLKVYNSDVSQEELLEKIYQDNMVEVVRIRPKEWFTCPDLPPLE